MSSVSESDEPGSPWAEYPDGKFGEVLGWKTGKSAGGKGPGGPSRSPQKKMKYQKQPIQESIEYVFFVTPPLLLADMYGSKFWRTFDTRAPGEGYPSFIEYNIYLLINYIATTILPKDRYTQHLGNTRPKGEISAAKVGVSYDQAVKSCEDKVEAIVKECQRVNKKYRDLYFNIANELQLPHSLEVSLFLLVC